MTNHSSCDGPTPPRLRPSHPKAAQATPSTHWSGTGSWVLGSAENSWLHPAPTQGNMHRPRTSLLRGLPGPQGRGPAAAAGHSACAGESGAVKRSWGGRARAQILAAGQSPALSHLPPARLHPTFQLQALPGAELAGFPPPGAVSAIFFPRSFWAFPPSGPEDASSPLPELQGRAKSCWALGSESPV